MFKVLKKIVLLIFINSTLIITCLGCGSVSSSLAKPNNKFSAYSDDKAFYVYGEISSVDLKKDKTFTVNAHLKNMTNYSYNLSSEDPFIDINFDKDGQEYVDAGTRHFQTIDAHGIIDAKMSFTPEETGKYSLSISSIFSAYNVSAKKMQEYKISFDTKHFSIK